MGEDVGHRTLVLCVPRYIFLCALFFPHPRAFFKGLPQSNAECNLGACTGSEPAQRNATAWGMYSKEIFFYTQPAIER